MRFIRLALLLAALGGPSMLAPPAAYANIEYPWCAVYGGRGGGASNCGFSTLQQCMATISGIGGSCEPNQFYQGAKPVTRKRKRPQNEPR